jgi:hypothetical protein
MWYRPNEFWASRSETDELSRTGETISIAGQLGATVAELSTVGYSQKSQATP